MKKSVCLALYFLVLAPVSLFAQSDLGFLDNFVSLLTPKDEKSDEGKKMTTLQKELRKTIRAVENRYRRLDDPAGLKAYEPKPSSQIDMQDKEIDSEQMERMVKRLRARSKKPISERELKEQLRAYLIKKGITIKPSVRVKRVRHVGRVERLGNWLSSLYDKYSSSK